jgi:hypothetical protein
LWAIAFGLGYVGFWRYFATLGEERSVLDLMYLTFQLFTFESGSVSGPLGWELEVARMLAPAVAAYTALQTLAVVFQEQLQLFRLRFIGDHVIICGLGRKGALLAERFRERGDRVVLVEQVEESGTVSELRAQGFIALTGDATNEQTLLRARVRRARHLISVCGDDGVNAEIGVQACDLVSRRRGRALNCMLHIVDPQLCDLLKERELEAGRPDAFRVGFFNVFDRGATAWLNAYPPFRESANGEPHLLIVGLGKMGESLLIQAARRWHAMQAGASRRMEVTVVDRDAACKVESLCLRYPRLGDVLRITAQSIDVLGAEFARGDFLFGADGGLRPTMAYICLDDESLGVITALALRRRVGTARLPVVIRMERDTGLAQLLRGVDPTDTGLSDLYAFGLLDRTCWPELVLGGTHELIARAIHEGYLEASTGSSGQEAASSVRVPWENLSEEYRESCRRQADHISVKLRAVGCHLAPLTDWDAQLLEFTPQELDRMARLEHERWMSERLRAGWSPGPRDEEARTNPNLVPWEELPEDVKELNRDMMRGLSTFLARAGLQIERVRQAGDERREKDVPA